MPVLIAPELIQDQLHFDFEARSQFQQKRL